VGGGAPRRAHVLVHEPHRVQPVPRKKKIRDAVFAVSISEVDREDVLARAGERWRDKIHVVRCGIDLAAWSGLERRPEPGRILSVGALREKKGHHVLVEACARLRDEGLDIHCEIVGEGPERDRLERRIAELDLGDRVRLLGALSPEETRERYRRAELFVLACVVAANGDLDGVPIVLMEAMMAGVPPVSTRLSGIPELIEDATSGLLAEPGDAAGLAARMKRLRGDPALRETMGRAATERAGRLCDASRNALAMVELLRGALP